MKYVMRLVDTNLDFKTLAHSCGTKEAAEDHAALLNERLGFLLAPGFLYVAEPARTCDCGVRDRVSDEDGGCWRCGGSIQ